MSKAASIGSANAPAADSAAASPWPDFWIACAAVFLVSLDTTMLFSAFGALRAGFPQASAAEMSWVLNAYTVVYAAMLIPAGSLADTYGRKRIFLLGGLVFLGASAACGAAPSVGWLISARAVQAIGAALLTPSSLSIVLGAFPIERRAVAISLWGAVGALAAAVGPSLGSFVVASAGWPWAFYLNLPLGGYAMWRGALRLREAVREGASPRLDLPGMALMMAGVGAFALAIVESGSPQWSRMQIAGLAGGGVLATLVFIGWSRLARTPLIDPQLFGYRHYRWVNFATLSFGAAFSMMFFGFFFYVTNIWHYSLPMAGLAITPGPLLVIPVAIVSGRIAARIGHRALLVAGSIVYALGTLWFLLVPGLEPAYLSQWLPGMMLSGAAVGMVLPSLAGAAVSRLPPHQFAVGGAVNQATRQIGSVMGVALTVLLLGGAHLVRADFTPFYATLMGLTLLTGLLCLPVDTRPQQR